MPGRGRVLVLPTSVSAGGLGAADLVGHFIECSMIAPSLTRSCLGAAWAWRAMGEPYWT